MPAAIMPWIRLQRCTCDLLLHRTRNHRIVRESARLRSSSALFGLLLCLLCVPVSLILCQVTESRSSYSGHGFSLYATTSNGQAAGIAWDGGSFWRGTSHDQNIIWACIGHEGTRTQTSKHAFQRKALRPFCMRGHTLRIACFPVFERQESCGYVWRPLSITCLCEISPWFVMNMQKTCFVNLICTFTRTELDLQKLVCKILFVRSLCSTHTINMMCNAHTHTECDV